jgi:hypothetical protein
MLDNFSPLTTHNFLSMCPEIYDRFYSDHSLVGSGNFSIPLNPILQSTDPWHKIVARQKINLQCLVGFATSADSPGTLTFGTAQLFTFESQDFEAINLSILLDHHEELLFYLRGYLCETLKNESIILNVLSESPRWYSLGFSGTFAGVLAHMIHYIKHNGHSPLSHGFLSDERSEIAEIARVIESILKPLDPEWQASYQTLYAEAAPSVFVFRQGRTGKSRELRKLSGIEYNLHGALEYGVIYSGVPLISSKIELKAGQTEARSGALWCSKELGLKVTGKNYSDSMRTVLSLENAHFLSRLDQLFDGDNSSEVGDFLRYGNELAHSFEKLDGKSEFLESIWKVLRSREMLDRSDITLLPLHSTTKWGSYVWYGRRGIARKNLYEAMREVQKRYPEIAVVYDGSVTSPSFRPEVAIIQDRAKSYQSRSCDLEGYLLQSPGNKEVIKDCNIEELSRGRLLVDQISRKIYIDGERVSSKEIFSQQLTIDLLDGYINNGKTEFVARDLGSSSYTQNKSEMMSKILHPLMRTIHRRLGRSLRISCSGSTLDFMIKFEEVDLELCSVSRIGSGIVGRKK